MQMSVLIKQCIFVLKKLHIVLLVYVVQFLRHTFDGALLTIFKNLHCFDKYHTVTLLACLTFLVFTIKL